MNYFMDDQDGYGEGVVEGDEEVEETDEMGEEGEGAESEEEESGEEEM